MSSVEEQLRRQIVESPDDDAPRMAYADLLAERGDPRGELITLQIALEGMDRGDARYPAARARERRLLGAHWAEWTSTAAALLGKPPSWTPSVLAMRRGFVHRVAVSGRKLPRRGAELLAAEPIQAVELLAPKPVWRCEVWPRLREVALRAHDTRWPDDLEVSALTALAADSVALGVPHARAIAEQGASLRRLELSSARPSKSAIRALSEAPALSGLRALVIYGGAMKRDRLELLLGSPHLAQLRRLDVGRIHDTAVECLCAWAGWDGLRELGLHGSLSGAASVALLRSGALERLESLLLGGDRAEDPEALVDALIDAELPTLRYLDLRGRRLGAAAARLAEAPWLEQLDRLELAHNSLTDEVVAALLGSGKLERLTRLSLHSNRLTDAACTAIADGAPPQLVSLELHNNPRIGDDGVIRLIEATDLAHLGYSTYQASSALKAALATVGQVADSPDRAPLAPRRWGWR